MDRLIVLAMAIAISFKAFGAEIKVLDITSDRAVSPLKKVTHLLVDVDDAGDITKVIYRVTFPNGKLDEEKSFAPEDYQGNYVNLVKEEGYQVVNLWINSFANHNGGIFKLDYLISGISGTRGALALELARAGETWEILDERTHKPIKTLHFVGNTFFGKLVGIARIDKK